MTSAKRARVPSTWQAPIYLALLWLGGCNGSPSQDILGSFFPAWLLCSAIGMGAASLSRVVLGLLDWHAFVLAPPLAYPALALAVTLFTWLAWFGH